MWLDSDQAWPERDQRDQSIIIIIRAQSERDHCDQHDQSVMKCDQSMIKYDKHDHHDQSVNQHD